MAGGGRISRFSRSLALGAGVATARFTITALVIVATSLFANLAVADIYPIARDELEWLFGALLAATAASLAMRLAAESHGWSPAMRIAMPAVAAIAAGLVIWNATALSVLAPPLVSALILSIPLAPYVARPDDERFWTFTLWGTVGAALAFLAVLLFVLGVSAILEMVRYLFEIGLSSDAYEHIYTTALTLVGPLFALGRIPSDFDETVPASTGDRLAAGVRFLFDWVGAPLALATALVLHLYAAKITLFGELPKNEIGWIVSFYAVLVLSFRVAIDPFISDGATTTRLFGKVWAWMLVIPIALLSYAAGLRILGEGFTLERYYLALGALAAAMVVIVQAIPRARGDIRLMAGIPLVLLALSSAGPWGVAGVVARSQMGMLHADFVRGEGAERRLDTAALDEAGRASLRTRIEAIGEVGELDRMLPLVAESQKERFTAMAATDPDGLQNALLMEFGVAYGQPGNPELAMAYFGGTKQIALDTSGFDVALLDRYASRQSESTTPDRADGTVSISGNDLVVSFGAGDDLFPLANAIAAIKTDPIAGMSDVSSIPPVIVDLRSKTGKSARLRISHASLEGTARMPVSLNVTLLLRRDEWPPATVPPAGSLGRDGEAGSTEPGGAIGERAR